MDISAPVFGRSGRLIGVLGAQLDWEWAEHVSNSVLSLVNLERSMEGIVVDQNGKVILGPDNLIGKNLEIQKYSINKEQWLYARWSDGIEYISATSHSGRIGDSSGLGWYVIIREPVFVAWDSLFKLRIKLIWASIVFLLLLALLIVINARFIARPIEKLTQIRRKIRKGDTRVKIPLVKEYREVEELSRALREMLEELEARSKRLLEAETLTTESIIARRVAESSNQAKSEFLAAMSHDLRTPLNAILGFAQLIDISYPDDSDLHDSIKHILTGGKHLLGLINQVLDLARIESGNIAYEMQPVEPDELLKLNIENLMPLARKRSIHMNLKIDGPLSPILADTMRMNQILNNLISNAIKYNKEDGRVDVSLFQSSQNEIHFVIKDTGMGIPEEFKNRVFEPFNRMGREQSSIEGTGIGLSITKQLIEQMNGKISFESEEGEGTSFSVVFPVFSGNYAGRSEKTVVEEIVNIRLIHNSLVILYIEDNSANVELMKKVIQELSDAHLLTARTADEGLEIARDQKPDIILMDIQLPRKNGFTALEEIKSDEATRDIPVIAMSASVMADDIERGLQAGFLHYLAKPINIKELIGILNEIDFRTK